MIQIRNKIINNEISEVSVETSVYNKIPVKVLDLRVKYKEDNNEILHYFEDFLKVDEVRNLKVNDYLEKVGIADYLYFVNGELDDSLEKDTDFIDSFKQVIVKARKINKTELKVRIEIEEIGLICEEIVIIDKINRRYAYEYSDDYRQIRLDNDIFKGYVCLLKFHNVEKPLIVYNGKDNICIKDNGYEYIEIYPDDCKYVITVIYDNKKNLIEWYFDISKKIGVENEIPYEDDLYLDMVITPDGNKFVIDEDELSEARNSGLITDDDVNSAYEILKIIEEEYGNNIQKLIELTNYLSNVIRK